MLQLIWAILIKFDNSNVDFSNMQIDEKQEEANENEKNKPSVKAEHNREKYYATSKIGAK